MTTLFVGVMQDDVRRKKLSLERVSHSRDQINEKLSDVNLQLDNADKAQKRAVTNKQASNTVSCRLQCPFQSRTLYV